MRAHNHAKTSQPPRGGCEVFVGTRITVPSTPFCAIVRDILPKDMYVSVALLGDTRARALNKKFRGKSYAPDVLSFKTDEHHGEIILNPRRIRTQAKHYGHSYRTHLIFLCIHAALHLRDLDHGPTMEKLEQKYLKKHT